MPRNGSAWVLELGCEIFEDFFRLVHKDFIVAFFMASDCFTHFSFLWSFCATRCRAMKHICWEEPTSVRCGGQDEAANCVHFHWTWCLRAKPAKQWDDEKIHGLKSFEALFLLWGTRFRPTDSMRQGRCLESMDCLDSRRYPPFWKVSSKRNIPRFFWDFQVAPCHTPHSHGVFQAFHLNDLSLLVELMDSTQANFCSWFFWPVWPEGCCWMEWFQDYQPTHWLFDLTHVSVKMIGDNHNFSWCDWRVIGCAWHLSCTRFLYCFLHCTKHSFGWLPVCPKRKNRPIPLAFGHFVGSVFLTAITWSVECWNVGVGTSGCGNPSGTQTSMGRGKRGCGPHDHSETLASKVALDEKLWGA